SPSMREASPGTRERLNNWSESEMFVWIKFSSLELTRILRVCGNISIRHVRSIFMLEATWLKALPF
ncbi:hypothetical protein ACQP3D_26065, partial [Escherichia coli]